MQKIVFTVSELNLASQKILETHFQQIWVEGEISNLSRPVSGHVYFSLKDPKAQIRAALFRQQANKLNFELRNGLLVQVQAKVSLYPDRGDYQLIVDKMELAGEGQLRQAYEQLLKRLQAEGLFDAQYKKPIPCFPKQIGVITSKTGAALRDILTVLKRRFPSIPIFIYPVSVQGANAAPEIVRALEYANAYPECEVLILARGGGSLEDLWPFNEEIVARAIFASQIPIITGVGHETDFTIADFVADQRAPTPSAAAECASPNRFELQDRVNRFSNYLKQTLNQRLNYFAQHLDNLFKRLKHPGAQIETGLLRLQNCQDRLIFCINEQLKTKQHSFMNLLRTLDVVSPLATLNRGYAIVSQVKTKKIIRSISDVKPKDKLMVQLADGKVECVV